MGELTELLTWIKDKLRITSMYFDRIINDLANWYFYTKWFVFATKKNSNPNFLWTPAFTKLLQILWPFRFWPKTKKLELEQDKSWKISISWLEATQLENHLIVVRSKGIYYKLCSCLTHWTLSYWSTDQGFRFEYIPSVWYQ